MRPQGTVSASAVACRRLVSAETHFWEGVLNAGTQAEVEVSISETPSHRSNAGGSQAYIASLFPPINVVAGESVRCFAIARQFYTIFSGKAVGSASCPVAANAATATPPHGRRGASVAVRRPDSMTSSRLSRESL